MVENYYAFGQPLPKWNSKTTDAPFYDPTKYRYGFNGKEDDDEWSKQDYGFRIYDGRIGRFLSVDPLTGSYPWYTPYQFAGNKVIAAIDLDGAEEQPAIILKENDKPKTDNLSSQEVLAFKVSRINSTAPYTYSVWSNRRGETKCVMTETQEFVYNKAKNRNNNDLANRMFKHWLLGQGQTYEMTSTEVTNADIVPFTMQGPILDKSQTQSTNSDWIPYDKKVEKIQNNAQKQLAEELSKMKVGDNKLNFVMTSPSGMAGTPGTLGQFRTKFEGILTKESETKYSFNGTVQYLDKYDFDPRWIDTEGLRSSDGESKVRQVRAYQLLSGSGTDFQVESAKINYKESGEVAKPLKPIKN
jgi:RHS repeat-associated protein